MWSGAPVLTYSLGDGSFFFVRWYFCWHFFFSRWHFCWRCLFDPPYLPFLLHSFATQLWLWRILSTRWCWLCLWWLSLCCYKLEYISYVTILLIPRVDIFLSPIAVKCQSPLSSGLGLRSQTDPHLLFSAD